MAISGLTKALKDIMRMDEGINGDAQYIGQIAWLLFLKAFDYKEQEWELLEDNYKPVMPTMYQWRNWAAQDEGITGDELLKFIEHMFDDIKSLETYDDKTKRKWLLKTTINDVINYMKSGTLLRQVINKLNKELDFTAMPDFHLFNDIYETMLKDLQSAGKSGEFYTPRPVTKFIVEMIDPKIHEKVLDPACGTGGFLTSVIDRYTLNTPEDYKLLQTNIKGIEKKPYPHILCVTNLILHNIDVPNIINDNTLRTPVADYNDNDLVDIIITNPPFGGAEEDAVTSSVPSNLRSKETADLFMVHIMYLLKENGRCGLVLPDGFLFGGNVKTSIKKKLLEECNLHTIIRLPNDVFAPYTNINTNLLFFEKGKKTENIWYYRLEMPEGYKHFSKTRPMLDIHFDPVRAWWNNREISDVSKLISIDEVIAKLDVLYMTRIQRERFSSPEEYDKQKNVYCLDREKMLKAKKDLIVLHPLPRVDEIAIDIDDDPRALYFKQAKYGMYVRMALILTILKNQQPTVLLKGEARPAVKCKNPNCITHKEAYLPKSFIGSGETLECEYCDERVLLEH